MRRLLAGLTGITVFLALGLNASDAGAVPRVPGTVGCPSSAPRLQLSQEYKSGVVRALGSRTDLWGDAALAKPDGPTYADVKDRLKPLMYALAPAASGSYLTDSGVYYIPFGQPVGAEQPGPVALHVADGSEIISDTSGNRATRVYVGADAAERYGECIADLATPALLGGYLPVLETRYTDHDGTRYSQESFATNVPGTNVAASYVRLTAQGAPGGPSNTRLRFQVCDCGLVRDGDTLTADGKTYAAFSAGATVSGRDVAYDVDLSDHRPHSVYLVRFTEATADAPAVTADAAGHLRARAADVAYWNDRLNQGATFSVPEPLVMDAQRSLLIQNLLMSWRYSLGNPYEAFYQPESSGTVGTLGDYGFTDVTEASLQSLLPKSKGANRRNWEQGEKLLHAATYYALTGDRSFIESNDDVYASYAADFAAQMAADPNGLLERQQYSSDIKHDVYGLHQIGVALQGLKAIIPVWRQIGRTDLADRYAPVAASLDAALHKAMADSRVRMSDGSLFTPVDLLDGIQPWDPITATSLGGYYNLVAWYGFGEQVYQPGSQDATDSLAYMYKHGSRLLGMLRARDSAVDNVYGVEQANFLADNDQADQLVLSLYGKLAAGMTRGTFVAGESDNIGPIATKWPLQAGVCTPGQPCTPPSPADGWTPDEYYRAMYLAPNSANNTMFLNILHQMLVHQVTRTAADSATPAGLQLAYATPRAWLATGKQIRVSKAPTAYGPLSYTIRSAIAGRIVHATVDVPDHTQPQSLSLRLRVPGSAPISGVLVDGHPYKHFDAATETIDLSGQSGHVQVLARFARG